jgi:hypothetical protein
VENVDSRVQSVFVYASLEFRSLAVLITIMYRNCGVRALYQLAFVLETQMQLVQCKLIAWGLITLCFRVVHFGKECFNLLTWYSLHSSSCCCDLVGVDFTGPRNPNKQLMVPLSMESWILSDSGIWLDKNVVLAASVSKPSRRQELLL